MFENVLIFASFKYKEKKNTYKMTLCNLHITMTTIGMGTMMMTTSTMMTPRG